MTSRSPEARAPAHRDLAVSGVRADADRDARHRHAGSQPAEPRAPRGGAGGAEAGGEARRRGARVSRAPDDQRRWRRRDPSPGSGVPFTARLVAGGAGPARGRPPHRHPDQHRRRRAARARPRGLRQLRGAREGAGPAVRSAGRSWRAARGHRGRPPRRERRGGRVHASVDARCVAPCDHSTPPSCSAPTARPASSSAACRARPRTSCAKDSRATTCSSCRRACSRARPTTPTSSSSST